MPFIIDDDTPGDVLFPSGCNTGLVPRSFEAMPMRAVTDIPIIPNSEWEPRIKEMEETKSRLSDIRMTGNGGKMIPSLDQNGYGYCWAHSGTHGVMVLRARDNQPYVPLSAFAVAATIKGGKDEGGWGAQGLEFIREKGVPDQKYWPQKSADLRHGTPECWANAALHKMTEGWVDVAAPIYGRKLSWEQVISCLLQRIPVIGDFNWWSHSVLLLDAVIIEPGSIGVLIWNSWSDSWGQNGTGILRGSRAVPDNATAPRVISGAAT